MKLCSDYTENTDYYTHIDSNDYCMNSTTTDTVQSSTLGTM